MDVPGSQDSERVAVRLKERLGFLPSVAFTDNRRLILRVKYEGGQAHLRIHKCFAEAPDEVMDAVAGFVNRCTKNRRAVIGAYFESQKSRFARPMHARNRKLVSLGECHDLAEIFNDLNARFLRREVDARITWGRVPNRRRGWFRKSRHITLGSYSRGDKVIIIHPNLDKTCVPRFVVESIVFHEMCHQISSGRLKNGRMSVHTREFKELELQYPKLLVAKEWVKKNFGLLLRKDAP